MTMRQFWKMATETRTTALLEQLITHVVENDLDELFIQGEATMYADVLALRYGYTVTGPDLLDAIKTAFTS